MADRENPNSTETDGLLDVPVDEHGRLDPTDAIFFVVILIAAPWIGRFAQWLLWSVLAGAPAWAAIALGGVAVFLLGRGFFAFRSRARRLYGAMEIAVALAAAVDALPGLQALARVDASITEGRAQLVTLAGAVYLVVRGLDDWSQGRPVALFRRVPREIWGRTR